MPSIYQQGIRNPSQSKGNSPLVTFRVDEVVCTNAHLVHDPGAPGKLPLDFFISRISS